ncbi:hydroxypyruvate reductase [mine drainage metagenome]|uniref:Hydroxypyruvate reductase n=1 Tax=mine drainage metagenome TaxID=410659 RepID=A0A1J5Q0U8_9ZZZZ
MTKPHVLQIGSYPEWDEAPLSEAYALHRYYAARDPAAFLAEVGHKVRAIATSGTAGASQAIIHACPNLELIAIYGVGYDAVDLATCRARGIAVTNTPDVLTGDVADLAIAMMLALTRRTVQADAWVRSGNWAAQGSFPVSRRAFGRRAGILGLGRIGTAIAHRLSGFGMDIAYSAHSAKATPWTFIPDPIALAARSDILFVALAASAETRHIVNAQVLRALGPEGIIINISRAANIDESALLELLASHGIAGAALDVFDAEPNLNPRFLQLDNVLLQPHIGSATVETRRAMGQLMRDNLTAHFAGLPLLTPVTE